MRPEQMRATYDRYVKGWSNVSDEERLELTSGSIAPHGIYSDPVSFTQGPQGMAEVMANFQRNTPNGTFEVIKFETQRDRALSTWNALDSEGNVRFPGHDAVIFGDDGLMGQVSGFFTKPEGMS